MAKRIVIIGGAAAGPKTAAKARRLDENAQITLVQQSPYMSMASCGYPYFIGGVFDDKNKLICSPTGAPRDKDFFKSAKNVDALTKTQAISINRQAHTITVKNLDDNSTSELPYDKLMLATGAKPVVPPIEGMDLKNVTTLHNLDNALFIKQQVTSGNLKKAVVVGGGLIGIEAAEAFALAGIKVTVVEKLPYTLPFLDPEMALLVQNHLKQKGATVITGTGAKRFYGTNGVVNGVELETGEQLEADLVIVAIGVNPNTELAAQAGLELGFKKAIKVNRFMQTSDPDIYAAGDCVEITDLVTLNKVHWPMGDAANLQGRVAAQNMVNGNSAVYEGAVMTGICKVFDFVAGSVGLSEVKARQQGYSNVVSVVQAGADKPDFMGAKPIIIKMVADATTGRLLGVQAVGMGDVAKRLATAAMAMHASMHVYQLVNLDLPYAPPFSPAIDNFITAAHVLENKLLGRMESLSSVQLKEMLDNNQKPFLLDVRSPQEFEQIRLDKGETLIPLGKLRGSLAQLPADKATPIVVYCKISLRGYEAYRILKGNGYQNVKVLEGGLLAWPFK